MKNKLAYLGFIGFLGVLGFFTEPLLMAYFGFFAFFAYAKVVPDELFTGNMRRSATAGFFVFIIAATLLTAFGAAFAEADPRKVSKILLGGFSLTVVAAYLSFIGNMMYFEFKERRLRAD